MHSADGTLTAIRRILLIALLAGMAGTAAELLLIGHFEDSWQLVPLALLALGTIVALAHAGRPGPLTVRLLQLLMALFVVSGGIGAVLHYIGNTEFEREMQPSIEGTALVKEAMTGAFPVLAPGTMVLLGLVGFALTHRQR
jgi:hypothetical protein